MELFSVCRGIRREHIVIAPAGSGSSYYNYKGTNSKYIVLMAVAEAYYKITYLNIGANRRISNGGVFNNCELSTVFQENTLNLPLPKSLPGRTSTICSCRRRRFCAETIFVETLYPFINQPGVNRIYNYQLSRARRIIENVFGIIATRFRILRKPIAPEKSKNHGNNNMYSS